MNSVLDSNHPVPLCAGGLSLPLASDKISAGFPSPAIDFAEERINLMAELVKHPQASFFLRVKGESMQDAGIADGDRVLVDKAVKPRHGHIVVATVDGEFLVKRLYQRGDRVKLLAANVTFPEIVFRDGQELEVFGVVIACIKQFKV